MAPDWHLLPWIPKHHLLLVSHSTSDPSTIAHLYSLSGEVIIHRCIMTNDIISSTLCLQKLKPRRINLALLGASHFFSASCLSFLRQVEQTSPSALSAVFSSSALTMQEWATLRCIWYIHRLWCQNIRIGWCEMLMCLRVKHPADKTVVCHMKSLWSPFKGMRNKLR